MKPLLLLCFLLAGSQLTAQRLSIAWQTDTVFRSPESVIYDDTRQKIYVSNINGPSHLKDGNGFISRLNSDGTIEQLKWIDSLHAPKGMSIYAGKLYVADIDRLVEIDLRRDKPVKYYPINGAVFLNDVTASKDGTIYISDSRASKIFSWKDGVSQLWFKQPDSSRTNGLLVKGKFLYVGSTTLDRINTKNKKVQNIANNTGGIDGVTMDKVNNLVYSNWAGRIIGRYQKKWRLLLDTRDQSINTADIYIAKKIGLLLVPTFFDNRLLAFHISN